MNMKQLDLKLTVAELIQTYPELREILNGLGFSKILNPMALKAMGNIMTLPRGAAVRNVPMDKVIAALAARSRFPSLAMARNLTDELHPLVEFVKLCVDCRTH